DLALQILADRRDIGDPGAGAVGDDRLVEALAAGIDQPRARQQRLARPGQAVDLEGEVDGGIADHQDGHDALHARSMKRFTRSGSTSFHQTPSRFSDEATMTPSLSARIAPTLASVTPLPTTTGRSVAPLTVEISSRVAWSPVRWPVTMATSASKNSTSRVSSVMLRSAVMACAPCLTWTSAKILTPPARSQAR